MRFRIAAAALAAALAAPLLVAAPSSATTDPIDPDALSALKAAFVASGTAFGERGGTVRAVVDLDLFGRRVRTRTIIESDAKGISHLRNGAVSGILGRTDAYFSAKGKPLAQRVTAAARRGLAKHGLHGAPRWYQPKARFSTTLKFDAKDITDSLDSLTKDLVALTRSTAGERSTYRLTTTNGQGGSATTQDLTVVVDGDLLTSVADSTTTMRFRYGHPPISVPRANRGHRDLIQAETMLAGFGSSMMWAMPKHASKAKRIAKLRRMFIGMRGAKINGVRMTGRPVPGGAELTGTIKSWKHPLTWRYVVKGTSVISRPVRTV